ncbi:unnamed protein product, partial [Urochloa humidicola]
SQEEREGEKAGKGRFVRLALVLSSEREAGAANAAVQGRGGGGQRQREEDGVAETGGGPEENP